jgi:hypothetical protein
MTTTPRHGQLTSADGVASEWLDLELDDHWRASCRLALQGGKIVIAEVRVRPRGDELPEGGITARLLRQVRVGDVLADPELALFLKDQPARFNFSDELLPRGAVHRPGRGGRDDLFFARVSAKYLDLMGRGSHRPVWDLMDALVRNGGRFTEATVRGFLNEARERGLLTTPARKGQAGGELTDRAEQLLMEAGLMSRPSPDDGPAGRGHPT